MKTCPPLLEMSCDGVQFHAVFHLGGTTVVGPFDVTAHGDVTKSPGSGRRGSSDGEP